jgi:anaerobic magnesium-protoporphyrin IX monomethyl ester cyclase
MILATHSYFLKHDAKQHDRMMPYSPLSTLICVALLRDRSYAVAHFDSTFAADIQEFEEALERQRPALVAIMEDNFNFLTKMCTVTRRNDAFAMIAAARKHGCRIVANGPDSTDRPGLYLDAGVDAVLLGEGEAALLDIAELWTADRDAKLDRVAGLALSGSDGRLYKTAIRPHQRDLDRLPLPAWEFVDAERYRKAWRPRHGRMSWNMATSRGCPYSCNWCAKPTFGRGYEQRSAKSVAMEMRLLKKRIGPDHIWFADDIFGLTAGWIRAFADEVNHLDARIPFMIQSRANLMVPGAVDALADAGAEEVWLGVESGSQRILGAMEKGTTVDECRAATGTLRSRGIRACWFIQLGYPGEKWDDICQTRELIHQERPDDIGVSVAYPLPGTRFYDLVKDQLGHDRNWRDTDDLAMLFQGTYHTDFYRMLRDVLHEEVRSGKRNDVRWARLAHEGPSHRSRHPVALAAGS